MRNKLRSDIKIVNDKYVAEIKEINEEMAYFKKAISVNGKVFNIFREMLILQHLMQS